jgi:polysaccharide export outer membrane protein
MNLTKLLARAIIFISCMASVSSVFAEASYYINSGDILEVFVWNEEALTRDVVVRPDGYISLPLAGQVEAGGQTTEQLQDAVAAALGKYLKDVPHVTVSVRQLAGYKIYVLGKVHRPGEYPINRQTDVMQALALGGGLNQFAAENKIVVLRRDKDGVQKAIHFEYGEVKGGDDLETNILLQSGDVVVVR